MLFVELTPFIAFRAAHWTDEDLRALQNHLLENPDSGANPNFGLTHEGY
jgi:hypothetical protein